MTRLRARLDDLRGSLFFLPAVAIVVGFAAARVMAGWRGAQWFGESTVDSARAVLSTVAGATITFSSIAFSVSLLVMQQGSSQFSPRVLPALTRDPFNRRVIALVMGTFTFTLVTLQRVRGPLGDGSEADIPQAAVAVAVILGIAAVFAVVGAIHHTAQMMHISAILDRIVDESRRAAPVTAGPGVEADRCQAPDEPEGGSSVVTFEGDGWVRGIDVDDVLDCLPRGSRLLLDTAPGRYAIAGSPMGALWPPMEGDEADDLRSAMARAVDIGPTRTVSQDPSLPVRQLVDVALKALSPGVNDPTTALDAAFHLGSVLGELLRSDPAANRFRDDEARSVVLRHPLSDEELAELALGELRTAAASQPAVVIYLFEMVQAVVEAAGAAGHPERGRPFVDQARLLRDAALRIDLLDHDRTRIADGFTSRFGA